MSLFIRKAIIDDIPFIQKIAETTWAVTYSFLPQGQVEYMLDWMYSTASLQQQMQEQQHQFYVAIVDENIVGFASVSKDKESIYKLNKLYVLPTTQKTGAGKALLATIITYCKENNASEIQLQVNRNNNAKDFYLKQGFTILYEADFEIGNGYFMNDYVMGLKL